MKGSSIEGPFSMLIASLMVTKGINRVKYVKTLERVIICLN
jgi:hypothetical protein